MELEAGLGRELIERQNQAALGKLRGGFAEVLCRRAARALLERMKAEVHHLLILNIHLFSTRLNLFVSCLLSVLMQTHTQTFSQPRCIRANPSGAQTKAPAPLATSHHRLNKDVYTFNHRIKRSNSAELVPSTPLP